MADATIYKISFGERVQALTGFDASSSEVLFGTTKNQDITTQFLKEGVLTVSKLLKGDILERMLSYFTFESSPSGVELEIPESEVRNVTLHNGTKMIACRKVVPISKGKLEDSSDILYATSTDPAYYIEGDRINALPYGYECRYGGLNLTKENQYGAQLLNITYASNEIDNFPNEAEDLVILHAATRIAELLLAQEEDTELYIPIIGTLKQDFMQKATILQTGSLQAQQQAQARGR
jgi:hypothetical protein